MDIYRKPLVQDEGWTEWKAPAKTAPEEDDGGWGDLSKMAGGMGGSTVPSNPYNIRPAFGSGNTVESGGFGKYRSSLMSFI